MLIEATMEALATGFLVGIKDMGAAGLTCSSSEMAAAGKSGLKSIWIVFRFVKKPWNPGKS